jgi:hypothetical protein
MSILIKSIKFLLYNKLIMKYNLVLYINSKEYFFKNPNFIIFKIIRYFYLYLNK